MHTTTPQQATAPAGPGDADSGTPRCTHCDDRLRTDELGRYACRPCQTTAEQQLGELGGLFTALNTTTALIPGTRRSSSTPSPAAGGPTASRVHAPVPLRIDALDLAATGGIVTRLVAIEDSWRTALGWTLPVTTDGTRVFAAWRTNPRTAISSRIRFLSDNLLWACSSYNEVAWDLKELRRLHTQATHTLAGTPRPGRVRVGTCPVPTTTPDGTAPCGTQLTATTTGGTIRCPTCHTRWADLTGWRELRHAQQALTDTRVLQGAAA